MGGERGSKQTGKSCAVANFVPIEPDQFVAEAPITVLRYVMLESCRLNLAPGECQRATLAVVAINLFVSQCLAQGRYRSIEHAVERDNCIATESLRDRPVAHGKESRGPTTITARCAKATNGLLNNRDTKSGVALK